MAVTDFFEAFTFLDYVSVDDGLGGMKFEFRDGATFSAGIIANSSTEAEIAYRSGVKTIFTIITEWGVELEHRDVIRRERDGRMYKITGNAIDNTAPDFADEVRTREVTAEVFELDET